jgi:pilus assembly protein CpaC
MLIFSLPGMVLAQALPEGKPTVRAPEPQRVERPVPATQPATQPAVKPRRQDAADRSAEELNRRFNERLQAQAREAEEARRREGGFFSRIFGGGPSRPVELADDSRVTQAQLPPASTPADDPKLAQAQSPAPAPTGPSTPTGRTPDQLAQTPPPVPAPSATPPTETRPPVPVPPPAPSQPTLITPPAGAPPTTPASAPVDEAAPRQFGRSAVVPTEQPTLSLDSGKGTVVKLKTPASTVFVANPDIADVQVKTGGTIYVFGKRPGETVLYAVDEQDRVILNTVVLVGHPGGRVAGNVAGMRGGSNIQTTTVGGSMVLQGRSDNPAAVEQARRMAVGVTGDPSKVINNVAMDGPNQVLLKVKIVEANRETLKRLGFNWESVFSLTNSLAVGFATPTDIVAAPFTRIGNPAGGAIVGNYQKGGTSIFGLIDLLATENMLTVLAEPNLTALSGETASFLAGGEFPIVVPQQANTFTVQFKQFGVSLAFTPTIHGNGRITLRAKPEVSQLSDNGAVILNGFRIPGLTVRRVDTTVELGSGQSFAIAGLIQNSSTQNIVKLPGLGDLPVLGALFKSDSFQRSESELVVIVTPYLVRPNNRPMSTPTDGLTPPNDSDRYLYGRTNHPTSARTVTRTSTSRVGGFMLE